MAAQCQAGAQISAEISQDGRVLNTEITSLTVLQIVPKLDPGGAERSAIEIAEALSAAGHRPMILAKPGRWKDWAERVGATLLPMDIGRKHPIALLHVWRLRRLFISQHIDIVHTRSRLPSWLTWIALQLTPRAHRPRWVTTVHGLHSVGRYSAIQHAGELAIAVSETTKSYVLANYRSVCAGALTVIERGADTRTFYPGQNTAAWCFDLFAQHPVLRERPMLLLAGRGTRLKGHSEALSLLAALRQKGSNAVLFFAGVIEMQRSEYLDELRNTCAALGLGEHVVFSESRDDLPALYAHSALVLQLSNRPESFGRTVAEALLCGAKVLGFDHGGVGEQLRRAFPEGLVPANDLTALAERAAALLNSDAEADLTQVPTLEEMQRKTLEAYQRLMSGE